MENETDSSVIPLAKCSINNRFESESLLDKTLSSQEKLISENILSKINVSFPYFNSCKWAPDGSCLLTTDSSNCISIYNFPPFFYGDSLTPWKSCLNIIEGENVYDTSWYPLMKSSDPITCCFVSTSKDHPVHLWDAYTGELRCSYKCFKRLEELDSPLGLSFSPCGKYLYFGFKNRICINDVSYCNKDPVGIINSKKFYDLHTGIFSCFSFTNDNDDSKIVAVGSYDRTVGLYDYTSNTLCSVLNVEEVTKNMSFAEFVPYFGGVTQVEFYSNLLFVGCRQSSAIICFDIRNPQLVYSSYLRSIKNQQKNYFSLCETEQKIVGGDTEGFLNVWPLFCSEEDFKPIKPSHRYKISSDSIPGCSYNQTCKLIATASGSRRFNINVLEDDIKDISSNSSLEIFSLETLIK